MILTIKKISFNGKLFEFYTEENPKYTDILDDEYKPTGDKELTWDTCCSNFMFTKVIEDADLDNQVLMDGYNSLIGYKMIWKDDRPIEIKIPHVFDIENSGRDYFGEIVKKELFEFNFREIQVYEFDGFEYVLCSDINKIFCESDKNRKNYFKLRKILINDIWYTTLSSFKNEFTRIRFNI